MAPNSVLPADHDSRRERAARTSHIFATAQAGRAVIQDFRPLPDSLEWVLGQRYLREKGSKVFIADAAPIPFVINNDGTLSATAAQVFFTSLLAADQAGSLEPEIFVLELGIGVGLFARYFLDAFRDVCASHGKDYYQRLTYVAADRAESMLVDACRHGLFRNHPGRCLLRIVDAMEPEVALAGDLAFRRIGPRPFRAVFLNYLLDCLPAADLDMADGQVRQLYVRTCLGRYVPLGEYTNLTPTDLARMADSGDERDQQTLLGLYGLFVAEYDYRPIDLPALPYGDFAIQFLHANGGHALHNYGAIQCLERLLALLHPQGLILANDYGVTQAARAEDFEHQRFSHAAFVGINFPVVKAYFADAGRCQWGEPSEDNGRIYSRLLGHALSPETLASFAECFNKAATISAHQHWQMARSFVQAGRLEGALSAYQTALARQPYNWVLHNEVAFFLTFRLRNLQAGIEMAKMAVELNPSCSPDLWNTLGDALYEPGHIEEARQAYLRAIRVNPGDVAARHNLAWVLTRTGKYSEALAMIAEGLALDETGAYYERLVKKQGEILTVLSQRRQQQQFFLANRVSKLVVEQAGSGANGSGQAQQPPKDGPKPAVTLDAATTVPPAAVEGGS